jgi:sugar/nucleoside kinase (ribokinase family)
VPADTGLATIILGEGGAKTMIFAPGANDAFAGADGAGLARGLHDAPARSVLVIDPELSPAGVLTAVEGAHESGWTVVLDRRDRNG